MKEQLQALIIEKIMQLDIDHLKMVLACLRGIAN